MSIDLRKFVDVNIKQRVDTTIIGTRDITVLFTSYGTKGTITKLNSLTEAEAAYGSKSGTTTLMSYIEVYFEHSGAKLYVYEGYPTVSASDIKSLPDEYINVCFADLDYNSVKSIAQTRASDSSIYGIKEKILFARTSTVDDVTSISNFAVKCSQVIGAEMTMAAYLSKINVYGIDTVFDYAFTQESILPTTIGGGQLSDTQFDLAQSNNINVDVNLAGATRVCGGNCKDGTELTNNFVRIILHQTVTDRLVNLLTQKIKSNSGIGKIYSTIAQEMTNYLSCGYLTTDKVWLNEDLKITVNGASYTIIEKGTALTNGYVLKVLPLSSLTETDKSEHKAPTIYLIVADQYAIRKITINGEVV